jgi:SAM-dependent methyltransferase
MMKSIENIGLSDVQGVYSGAEGDLWELIMGQQIHIGGFLSSMDLAERAGIGEGMSGVDLCCCTGAGMRFLVRFRNVAQMMGVDATPAVVEKGRRRSADEGLAEQITFTLADACDTGLPAGSFDFAWGEDAWCYVVDKKKLINEAARLIKPGGVIAFTDWIEGPAGLSAEEADRFLRFMKFPNVENLSGYSELLAAAGCDVLAAQDTGRFPPYVDLYLDMLEKQLTYDALRILGFNVAMLETLAPEMKFMQQLAHAEKIAQGLFVARKKK